jgi:hypothetical protein
MQNDEQAVANLDLEWSMSGFRMLKSRAAGS